MIMRSMEDDGRESAVVVLDAGHSCEKRMERKDPCSSSSSPNLEIRRVFPFTRIFSPRTTVDFCLCDVALVILGRDRRIFITLLAIYSIVLLVVVQTVSTI